MTRTKVRSDWEWQEHGRGDSVHGGTLEGEKEAARGKRRGKVLGMSGRAIFSLFEKVLFFLAGFRESLTFASKYLIPVQQLRHTYFFGFFYGFFYWKAPGTLLK